MPQSHIFDCILQTILVFPLILMTNSSPGIPPGPSAFLAINSGNAISRPCMSFCTNSSKGLSSSKDYKKTSFTACCQTVLIVQHHSLDQ